MDCRLGDNGSHTCANDFNLSTMDLIRATTCLGERRRGDDRSQARDDGSRASNNKSHAGAYFYARTHPSASKVYKDREVSFRHTTLFLLFLLPNMSGQAPTSMRNILSSRPPLYTTMFVQDHISAQLRLCTTTSARDHIYKRLHINLIDNWVHVFKLTWHPLGM